MRVDFFLYSTDKKTSARCFLKWRSWPIAFPKKGDRITFACESKDPNDNKEKLKEGEVMHDQSNGDHCMVWVDMGDFTQFLRDDLTEVVCWKVFDPVPT